MKKTINSALAVLMLAGLAVFLTAEGAEAFCIYNKTDKEIHVDQAKGHKTSRGLSALIPPNGRECCNWKNKDCNKEGKRDSIVKFKARYLSMSGVITDFTTICMNFPIQAGGWLTVEGRDGNYKCVGHDY